VAEPFRLLVLTPVQTLIEAAGVAWAQIQLADGGPIAIYPGHAPLLAETVAGPLRYADESGEHSLDLLAGFLHVRQDGVTILTAGQVQAGNGVDREPGAPAEGIGVREEADKLQFERLAQTLLGDEAGTVENGVSWRTRNQDPDL
jgi:F0F1-type ATP synthase epsilon subunit